MTPADRYVITIRDTRRDGSSFRRLRAIVKLMLRAFGFKVERLEPVTEDAAE